MSFDVDRMLEEHFEDQLNEIIRLSPRGRQTMLFSATMTDEVSNITARVVCSGERLRTPLPYTVPCQFSDVEFACLLIDSTHTDRSVLSLNATSIMLECKMLLC